MQPGSCALAGFIQGVVIVPSVQVLTGYPEHFFTDDFGLDRGQLGLDTSDSLLEACKASSCL